jgi:hypothetical protein
MPTPRLGEVRSLIDEIRVVPENSEPKIEPLGDLAGILALGADGKKSTPKNRGGLQVSVVAGARNQRCLQAIRARVPIIPRSLTAATPVRIR